MAEDYNDKLAEGKLDLVPMIDCIMLLLLFFILTSKFTAPEKALEVILPTDKGPASSLSAPIIPKQINICVYPEGLSRGGSPAEYLATVEALHHQEGDVLPNALLRIGGDAPMLIPGSALMGDPEKARAILSLIRDHIANALGAREDAAAATRHDQVPTVISCYSGLSWKFAVVVYDSVRAYEKSKSPGVAYADPKDWVKAREIDFAPPRIRNYNAHELADELYEIVNMP